MTKVILQPSRIGMTVPIVASKYNLLSDFLIRIINDYELEIMDSIQFNGQMISLDYIQDQINRDSSLKQQVKTHYNPKIQPLGGKSPWNSSLSIFLEQPNFNFQTLPASCLFGFEEMTINLQQHVLHFKPYRYKTGKCPTLTMHWFTRSHLKRSIAIRKIYPRKLPPSFLCFHYTYLLISIFQ